MSNSNNPAIPDAIIKPQSRRHLSLVWIIPVIAALFGAWLIVQNIRNEGPTVTLRFNNAEGIEPGKTKIKYKDVDIGEVKAVSVSIDRKQVILTAKLIKEAKNYLFSDTQFWIVRPRISGGVVSGLSTLLSGAYIGVDIGKSKELSTEFIGLEVPPIVTDGLPGRQFILQSKDIGSLDVGAVVTYRRIPVGQVVAYSLDKNGTGVTLKIFVNSPYDQFVTNNTRFWHASGIDLSLDANGLRLETQSLNSIVQGGIAFEIPPDLPDSVPAQKDKSFKLYADHEEATKLPDDVVFPYSLYFKDSLRGLTIGAPVDFHGIVVGEVTSIKVEYLEKEGIVRFPVGISIYPNRMRSRSNETNARQSQSPEHDNHVMTDKLVASGLRGQLKTGNLLTGQLFISLDFYPNSKTEQVNWNHSPPVLPSIDGGLGEIQESVASILKKIDKIPVNQLSDQLLVSLKSLNKTLTDTDKLISNIDTDVAPELKNTLVEARSTMNAAQNVLFSDSPVQSDLRDALRQVSKSARAVGNLADYIDRHPESMIRGKSGEKSVLSEGGQP